MAGFRTVQDNLQFRVRIIADSITLLPANLSVTLISSMTLPRSCQFIEHPSCEETSSSGSKRVRHIFAFAARKRHTINAEEKLTGKTRQMLTTFLSLSADCRKSPCCVRSSRKANRGIPSRIQSDERRQVRRRRSNSSNENGSFGLTESPDVGPRSVSCQTKLAKR